MKYPTIDSREIDVTDEKPVREGCKLIMTCGFPRSGKSTWARSQDYPIVCPDAIRLAKTGQRWWGPIEHEVWATARTMVRALFLAGHDIVILDSTCGTRQQRDTFLPSPDIVWERCYKTIETSSLRCKTRAMGSYPELVPVIDWMQKNWEPIQPEENIEPWEGE